MRRRPHWRVGQTVLLSHPGCLLSRYRPREQILGMVRKAVGEGRLTVLVTHWWEYFIEGRPDEPLIRVLHDTAEWLAEQPEVKAISFSEGAALNARVLD